MGYAIPLFFMLFVLPPVATVVFMLLIKYVPKPNRLESVDRQPAFPVVTKDMEVKSSANGNDETSPQIKRHVD